MMIGHHSKFIFFYRRRWQNNPSSSLTRSFFNLTKYEFTVSCPPSKLENEEHSKNFPRNFPTYQTYQPIPEDTTDQQDPENAQLN
jgi:hypothetical protein